MNDRILVSDRAHSELIDLLEEAGFDIDYQPDITYAEFKQVLHQYQGVIINSKTPMQKEQIQQADKLKFIGRLGSGLDIIDLDAAKNENVKVLSAPEGNANAVAEHCLGMILALNNKLCAANYQVRQFEWNREQNRGTELENRKIGIIGYGNNGSAFARKLAGLNVKVFAYDKYKQRYAAQERYVVETDLNGVLKQSDIISLHIPLTAETRFMVDKVFLQKCKPGVIIVNSSRGKVLKTEDLIRQLELGYVSGACLDVLENEEISAYSDKEKELYERLFQFKNVLLSPHIAGWTKESLQKIAQVLALKILKLYGLK
jgi:D-3-phosphoglycerate dehydrogenase